MRAWYAAGAASAARCCSSSGSAPRSSPTSATTSSGGSTAMRSSETELPRYADVWPDARPPAAPPEQDAAPDEEELLFRTPFPRPRVGALRNLLPTLAVAATIGGPVWFFDRPAGFGSSQAVTATAGG